LEEFICLIPNSIRYFMKSRLGQSMLCAAFGALALQPIHTGKLTSTVPITLPVFLSSPSWTHCSPLHRTHTLPQLFFRILFLLPLPLLIVASFDFHYMIRILLVRSVPFTFHQHLNIPIQPLYPFRFVWTNFNPRMHASIPIYRTRSLSSTRARPL
jgi:hypothetical protein